MDRAGVGEWGDTRQRTFGLSRGWWGGPRAWRPGAKRANIRHPAPQQNQETLTES